MRQQTIAVKSPEVPSVAASTVKLFHTARGSANPNAHAAAASTATIGSSSRCASRVASTSSKRIDITAKPPGMLSFSRLTNAPGSKNTISTPSAISRPPKLIGSDSRSARTAGALPKRWANGATRRSSQLSL